MVAADAAVQRAHHGHRAHAVDQACRDKALGKGAALALAAGELALRPLAQTVHLAVDVDQRAHHAAQHHREDDQQRIARFNRAHESDQNHAQAHALHHRMGDGGLHPAPEQKAQACAQHDGRAVDQSTDQAIAFFGFRMRKNRRNTTAAFCSQARFYCAAAAVSTGYTLTCFLSRPLRSKRTMPSTLA